MWREIILLILWPLCASKIVDLDDNSFDIALSSEPGFWLLYFYAPWCHHCKKFSPVLDDLASNYSSSLNIGKIDATTSKEISSIHEISTYPTIKFYRDGKFGYYSGERKYDALASFISKVHDASVKTVFSETELNSYLQDITFAFVLSIDPAMKDSSAVHDYFVELADEHKMHANFILFERPGNLQLQKLEVNRNPLTLPISSANLYIEKREIQQFIEHHNHLLVTPLDKSNLRRLGRTGKPLIIAIIKENHATSNDLLSVLEDVVAALDIEIAHQFVIGFMDGDRYATYLERYRRALSPPSLLILDLSVNGYYVTRILTKDRVQETVMQAITKTLPYIEVEPVDLGFFQKIRWKLNHYYPWSLLCCLPLVFFGLSFLFPHPNSIKEKAS